MYKDRLLWVCFSPRPLLPQLEAALQDNGRGAASLFQCFSLWRRYIHRHGRGNMDKFAIKASVVWLSLLFGSIDLCVLSMFSSRPSPTPVLTSRYKKLGAAAGAGVRGVILLLYCYTYKAQEGGHHRILYTPYVLLVLLSTSPLRFNGKKD